jgi:hypothetical protein
VHAIESAQFSGALLIGGEMADGVFEIGVGGEGVPPGGEPSAAPAENSAGLSAPGQEARSVRHSVTEVRAVVPMSGTSRDASPLPDRTMTFPSLAERETPVSSGATSSAMRSPE